MKQSPLLDLDNKEDQWSSVVLPEQKKLLPFLDKWLSWSLPNAPEQDASIDQLETYRRARLAASLLIVLFLLSTTGLISAIALGATKSIMILGIVEAISILAFLCNRAGKLVLAGLLFIGLYSVGIYISFAVKSELTLSNVIGYDLLTMSVLLCVAFFPAWSVFVVAACNCLFITWSVLSQGRVGPLDVLFREEGAHVVLERTLSLQVMVAFVVFLWVQSANRAIRRADRAEVIARLQYNLAERDRALATQKGRLEQAIQQIVNSLTAYSNGNTEARVPLDQSNVLWHVAGSVNNLLGRVQRLRYAESELDKMRPLVHHARQLEQENIALRAALRQRSNSVVSPTSHSAESHNA